MEEQLLGASGWGAGSGANNRAHSWGANSRRNEQQIQNFQGMVPTLEPHQISVEAGEIFIRGSWGASNPELVNICSLLNFQWKILGAETWKALVPSSPVTPSTQLCQCTTSLNPRGKMFMKYSQYCIMRF